MFNVQEKLKGIEKKKMEAEIVVLSKDEIDLKDDQVLLNNNCSLVLDIEFVAAVFYLPPKKLMDSIRMEPSGAGFLACIDETILRDKDL